MPSSQVRNLLFSIILGFSVWWFGPIEGLKPEATQLLAIFLGVITAIILQVFPMGAVTLLGLTLCLLTKTLTFEDAFSGFTHKVPWLILMAFFIAHGFVKSGLGNRVAYSFLSLLGKNTLGLSYGLVLTEFFLAPVLPSLTARAGGIIFPVVRAISLVLGSEPNEKSRRKMGAYLVLLSYHASLITAAMFLTAMAANPLSAELAQKAGVNLTWAVWAGAAIVPGLLSLLLLPLFMLKIYPPELKNTRHASNAAKNHLQEMGVMKNEEWVMLFVFVLLIILWSLGSYLNIDATTTALLGFVILIISRVIDWKDLLKIHNAWESFVWFGVLIGFSIHLNALGVAPWFGNQITQILGGMPWVFTLILFVVVYYYLHYFFASSTAHVAALFLPFLMIAVHSGVPVLLATLVLVFASNLCGGLTNYGSGPAPILYASGYVSFKEWWRIGFIMSLFHFALWSSVGTLWWKFLGVF